MTVMSEAFYTCTHQAGAIAPPARHHEQR